jgi:hypothetical protein
MRDKCEKLSLEVRQIIRRLFWDMNNYAKATVKGDQTARDYHFIQAVLNLHLLDPELARIVSNINVSEIENEVLQTALKNLEPIPVEDERKLYSTVFI